MTTPSKKPARTKPEAKKGEAAPPPSRSRATPSARRSAGPRVACRSGLAASRSGRRRSRASSPRSARPLRITSDGLPPVAAAGTGELLQGTPRRGQRQRPPRSLREGSHPRAQGSSRPHSASAETGRLRWLISVSPLPPPPLAPRANRGAPLSRGPLQPRASWGEGLSGATMPLRADEVIE